MTWVACYRCCYNVFNFPQIISKETPIACPLGRAMGCLLWIKLWFICYFGHCVDVHDIMLYKADSRFAPSQWETSLQSNAVSHWLGANLESALVVLDCFITAPNCILNFKRLFDSSKHWAYTTYGTNNVRRPLLRHGCAAHIRAISFTCTFHTSVSCKISENFLGFTHQF